MALGSLPPREREIDQRHRAGAVGRLYRFIELTGRLYSDDHVILQWKTQADGRSIRDKCQFKFGER